MKRPCPRPRCGVMITTGKYCAKHTREMDAARGAASARGYDHLWSKLSAQWLRRYPWCGQRLGGEFWPVHSRCVRSGMRVRAGVVDHIQSLRDGGPRLDPRNLQSLCTSCNTAKG
jgi:5-methylcytosine-specific restriction enzyme A